jgi:hypothetical protein
LQKQNKQFAMLISTTDCAALVEMAYDVSLVSMMSEVSGVRVQSPIPNVVDCKFL